ncbi:nucleoside monophosphate kinase [Saccharothrix sp. S26]|uniref:nucleoside monophosphate kinase n=1 Tax=Saccharothrix sp. S26 TaxID=2907215 RepID=UPI001F30FA22|nr:nucleoside monophosphate kinase [Saccharothrix sp. S26]MCE6997753.1 nucleoside monophosphate kinase [Saccharothrix sp. S26]
MRSADPVPLVVFVVGAPGTGKSTVVRHLAEHLRCVEFLSGEVLRRTAEEDTEIGRAVADRLSRDETMPVALYCRIVRRELGRGRHAGLVFDGFPRTLEQCLAIPAVLDAAGMPGAEVLGLSLHVPPAVSIDRIRRRNERAEDTAHEARTRLRTHARRAADIATAFAERWPYVEVDATARVDRVVRAALVALSRQVERVAERG